MPLNHHQLMENNFLFFIFCINFFIVLFQFRVALLLSENEAIYSQPSVIISTNEEGVPESKPQIILIRPVDQTRIMVSWKCGLKNNGKIISYSLLIKDLSHSGYNAIKVNFHCHNFFF
jgi:hypothetical protein